MDIRGDTKHDQLPSMYVHITDPTSSDARWAPTMVKNNIISGWPATKDHLHLDIGPYWSYKDDLAVIDGIGMKGRHIIIPKVLKQQALDQLYVNHMGIKKKTTCV